MSLEKLNKLSKMTGKSYYATTPTKKPAAKKEYVAPIPEPKDSILDKDTYLLGKIKELQQEIYLLRTDLMTMVDYINKDLDIIYTAQSLRQKYSDYRASEQHVLRRVSNKTEAIIKDELHFNNEPTDDIKSTETDV